MMKTNAQKRTAQPRRPSARKASKRRHVGHVAPPQTARQIREAIGVTAEDFEIAVRALRKVHVGKRNIAAKRRAG
jgi:predicted DNA-binding protein